MVRASLSVFEHGIDVCVYCLVRQSMLPCEQNRPATSSGDVLGHELARFDRMKHWQLPFTIKAMLRVLVALHQFRTAS